MKDNLQIYIEATNIARNAQQTVGQKNDLYITLAQLERILMP